MSDFRLNLLLLESQGGVRAYFPFFKTPSLINKESNKFNKYKETDGKQIHTEVAVSSCVDNP